MGNPEAHSRTLVLWNEKLSEKSPAGHEKLPKRSLGQILAPTQIVARRSSLFIFDRDELKLY